MSSRPLHASLALLLFAPLAAAQTPRPSQQYSIEEFMGTTKLAGASFSPDETRLLYSSNEGGVFNAWMIGVDGKGSEQVTHSSDSTYAVACFPSDERILITRDRGGDEQNHLYVIEADGKERDLTPGELKAQFGGFSHDLEGFYVLTNERDARFFDLYRYDATSYARALIYQDDTGYGIGPVSNDGRWIALDKVESTADSDVYLWNVEAKTLTCLTEHAGSAQYSSSDFDVASTKLYYTTNSGGEFQRVMSYDLASGAHAEVERADWDVVFTSFSHDGKYRISAINADAQTQLVLREAKSGKEIMLPEIPSGDVTTLTIARSETMMAFYVNGDRSPNDLYVMELPLGTPKRLTRSLSSAIHAADLVEGSVVRFPSFDGLKIPNILLKPHQATSEHKAPALVWVHGGPGGQTRRGYNAFAQYLVNHGYVILGINNRGSSGYGQTFFTADDKKHGAEPLWDCVAAKEYLASLPYVDGERIGILGGSYGGYMVLAALAYQPEVFDVGVDLFGVSNWVRTLTSIPPYWESFRKALYDEIGDPETELERLKATSPLFSAETIAKPLIVLQGANDPRVLQPESDEIVAAVKANDVPVEYVLFPDEGHGFTKTKNEIEGYGKVLEFLDRYLKAPQE